MPKSELPPYLIDSLKQSLTFDNPRYEEAKKRMFGTRGIDKQIVCYQEQKDFFYIYRGFMGNLISFLGQNGCQHELVDQRRLLPEIDLCFFGDLREYQTAAMTKALTKHFGILVAPCGSGKTVIGLNIIVERKQPTLIIVHTKELLNQWIEQIKDYLGIEDVGIIGDRKEEIRAVTVGMVQTLGKRNLPEISKHFGQIIIDECHHTPASTFTQVVSAFDCFYQLGLSATPYRRDRLNKLLYYVVGNVSATITDQDLQDYGTCIKPKIIARETLFAYNYKEDADYQPMISRLVEDTNRNQLIVTDIIKEAKGKNNYLLVLTDRKEHCKTLARLLIEQGVNCAILTGDLPKKQREQAIHDLETGLLRVVLATGQIAGEGLDIPKLNRLFVTTPIRWKGKIKQYVGRVLRTAPGKRDARIYDYVDTRVGVLVSAYRSRYYQVYEQLN
jgi:superfamily II DNA or RNA helicase